MKVYANSLLPPANEPSSKMSAQKFREATSKFVGEFGTTAFIMCIAFWPDLGKFRSISSFIELLLVSLIIASIATTAQIWWKRNLGA